MELLLQVDVKNTRVTYQIMMNNVFKDHICNIFEVYLDDMIVNSS